MQTDELYRKRLERILDAVALEKVDRVPVVLEYSGFAAYVTGTRMAEFLRCPETNLDTMMRAFEMVGDADAINYGSFWPYGLCYDYMSKVSVPGVDLPEDDMWQVVESELMTRDDYDAILRQDWPEYSKAFISQRLFADVPASMLFMDSPEEVYAYCTRLIRELGPRGFILQSGCDIPANAKLENVKAMVAAAVES